MEKLVPALSIPDIVDPTETFSRHLGEMATPEAEAVLAAGG